MKRLALVVSFLVGCSVAAGDVPMCGKCASSRDCRARLTCVNGVCETAPPSCHVKIGL